MGGCSATGSSQGMGWPAENPLTNEVVFSPVKFEETHIRHSRDKTTSLAKTFNLDSIVGSSLESIMIDS